MLELDAPEDSSVTSETHPDLRPTLCLLRGNMTLFLVSLVFALDVSLVLALEVSFSLSLAITKQSAFL